MYEDSKLITDILFSGSLQYENNIELEEIQTMAEEIQNPKVIKLEEYDDDSDNTQIIFYDHPDLLIVLTNAIIAVEHFVIDASKKTSKGYQYKRKYNENHFEERFKANEKNILDGESFSSITEKISTDLKYENLINNLKDVFRNHYKKVKSYKEQIKKDLGEPTKPIYTLFFIEYDIKLPSFIMENGQMRPILPHNDIELFSFLKEKNDIEGILVFLEESSNNPIIKQYVSMKAIESSLYKVDNKKIYDIDTVELFDFENPMMNSFVAKIET